MHWIRGVVSLRVSLYMVSDMNISPLAGSGNPVARYYPVTLLAELSHLIYAGFCSHSVFEEESTKTMMYYIYATDTNVGPLVTHGPCQILVLQAYAWVQTPLKSPFKIILFLMRRMQMKIVVKSVKS
jgi:hypothetical protein